MSELKLGSKVIAINLNSGIMFQNDVRVIIKQLPNGNWSTSDGTVLHATEKGALLIVGQEVAMYKCIRHNEKYDPTFLAYSDSVHNQLKLFKNEMSPLINENLLLIRKYPSPSQNHLYRRDQSNIDADMALLREKYGIWCDTIPNNRVHKEYIPKPIGKLGDDDYDPFPML